VIADVDVVIACGEINASTGTDRDVAATGGIGGQRLIAHGHIVGAGGEAYERSVSN
jgi:hypothetical protein